MPKNLIIEFGAFDGGYSQDPCAIPVIQEIREIQEGISAEFGDEIELILMPYEGTRSVFGGGRGNAPTQGQMLAAIRDFNAAGVPFMVVLNGGLGIDAGMEVDLNDYKLATERRILSALAEHGERGRVQNVVTLLNRKLLEVIRRDYPSLKAVASCIGFVGGRQGVFKGKEEYSEAFELFDGVVPLNQHSTPEFLEQWRRFAGKMVFLLNAKCDSGNLYQCFLHYLMMEGRLPFEQLHNSEFESADVDKRDFVYIEGPAMNGRNACSAEMDGQLWSRTDDLATFVRWGVHQFKLGRDPFGDPLNSSRLRRFVKMFLENYGKE